MRSRGRTVALTALVLLAALATASAASAATFTVNDLKDAALATPTGTTCSSTDAGGCTLRAAVQAADNTGGSNTIMLLAGTYKLTIALTAADDPSNGDLDVKNSDNLTINGAGVATTTINANHIDRAFAIDSGSALSLSGVTITGGKPATLSSGSGNGGDVYSDGTLSISNSVLENSTAFDGGAIYNNSGALTLAGDTLASMEANHGTGVYLNAGTLTDTGSTFVGLAAFDNGGGVYANSTATSATFTNSTFTDDSSGTGGAIHVVGGSLSVTGATFSNDYAASSYGGAIYYSATGGSFTISRSLFNGNSASSAGGAVYFNNGAGLISGSHFTGNGAVDGGAIYSDGTGLRSPRASSTTTTPSTAAESTRQQGRCR